MLIGGYFIDLESSLAGGAEETMQRLAAGRIKSTRSSPIAFRSRNRAKEAFDLLHDRPRRGVGSFDGLPGIDLKEHSIERNIVSASSAWDALPRRLTMKCRGIHR